MNELINSANSETILKALYHVIFSASSYNFFFFILIMKPEISWFLALKISLIKASDIVIISMHGLDQYI